MERTVSVWGKPHQVDVHQKSRSVWIAVGDCLSERVEVKDRSATAALAAWRKAAEYRSG
jgi:hypothetical protein